MNSETPNILPPVTVVSEASAESRQIGEGQEDVRACLKAQFSKTKRCECNGETVEYIDLVPPKILHPRPLVVIIGFVSTATTITNLLLSLAEQGYRVMAVQGPYQGIPTADTIRGIPPIHMRKAAVVHAMLSHAGVTSYDIVGNSEGAVVATAVAKRNPQAIKKLILWSPASIGKEDGAIATGLRFVIEILNGMRTQVSNLWEPDGAANRQVVSTEATRVALQSPTTIARQIIGVTESSIAPCLRNCSNRD